VKSPEPAVELFKSAWKILQNLHTMKNTPADVILDFEVLVLLTQHPDSRLKGVHLPLSRDDI
jgi:hypothetical protein